MAKRRNTTGIRNTRLTQQQMMMMGMGQGAYVCENEAERAAIHLRSLGKPEYVSI